MRRDLTYIKLKKFSKQNGLTMFIENNYNIFKKKSRFLIAAMFLFGFYTNAVNIYSCSESTALDDNHGPDTTSHNFTWIVDTIGDRGSYLHDVDILDNDNIYAVGYIQFDGEDDIYSAVKWNGIEWKYLRFKDADGFIVSPIRGITAIEDNNLWLAAGSIYNWNGQLAKISFQREIGSDEIIKKLWYISYNNIYGISNNGQIVYFDGSSWKRLNRVTETIITDIWGTVDSKEAKQTILCTVSDRWHVGEKRLLSVNTNNIKGTLNWNYEDRLLMSVWFDHDSPVYVSGTGLVMRKDSLWQEIPEVPNYRTLRVRGSSRNNVFVAGVYGLLMHYNGATWRRYSELEMENGELRSLAVKDNIVVAAGITDNRGVIIRGIRE